eukprot:367441-Pelagomonas_calceolata.AAC.1
MSHFQLADDSQRCSILLCKLRLGAGAIPVQLATTAHTVHATTNFEEHSQDKRLQAISSLASWGAHLKLLNLAIKENNGTRKFAIS